MSIVRPLLALAALAASALSALAQTPLPAPGKIIPVVLKLDDVRTNDSGYLSARWRRVGELAKQRKIKISLGVITNSLENAKPDYIAWLRDLQASGLVELWFHGYAHDVRPVGDKEAAEFSARSYDEQKAIFAKSQALVTAKLGAPFTAYGPPGGGNLPPTDDDIRASARVLADDPAMKVWLYPKPHDDVSRALTAAGKVFVLDRVWAVNVEQPLFVPNPEKFATGYVKNAANRDYFVIQGHPNKWDDARWAEFVKLIDYLQQHQIPTALPSELAATLSAASPKSNKQ